MDHHTRRRRAPAPFWSLALFPLVLIASCTVSSTPREPSIPFAHTFERGAVACDHIEASRAGSAMLERGGNAIDAAVAASFALSVVRPHSCGLGGGGFMVLYLPADPDAPIAGDALHWIIDYRERAPLAVQRDHFFDLPENASRDTGHAVAVPGTVLGLLTAHDTFGTLPLREVMAPAIRLAREGYRPGFNGENAIQSLATAIEGRQDPGARWLRDTYIDRAPGSLVRNPEQARLLEAIARDGHRAFYEGETARAILRAVRDAGGVMTQEDLDRYETTRSPAIAQRITLGERTYKFLVMPPPSSGGVAILQTLGILKHYHQQMVGHVGSGPLSATSPHDPVYMHALTECMKHAFADRARFMADTQFVEVPINDMLDDAAHRAGASALHPERTMPNEQYGVVRVTETYASILEDHGTSHLSVIDQWGHAVACTETINTVFGSRIAVPELGIVLNNEMDDFLTRLGEGNAYGLTQSERNLPAPRKRPLSSMSPTIVLDEAGNVVAVAGASGGPRIITGTLHALMNALHFGMHAGAAVSAERWHHQWQPDTLFVEPALLLKAEQSLRETGHTPSARADLGVVQLLVRRNGVIEAASDPRKGGAPAGH